jgi:DinB superfamily
MNNQQLIQNLTKNHQAFIDYISALSDAHLQYAPPEKWTAAQQLDHIHKSIKPLAQALLLPKFIPRLLFGKANRPSRTYDELVEKYNTKLAAGGRATGRFIPPPIVTAKKDSLVKLVLGNVTKICNRLAKFNEADLDTLLLPHPLLGKLTVREMMYFSIYHVTHHEAIIKRDLTNA